MAQQVVHVCDRCGAPRAAQLTVDLDHRADGDEDVTEEAHMDLCVGCLARACKLALPYIPMAERRAWYAALRMLDGR